MISQSKDWEPRALLDAEQVADWLGCSVKLVRKLAAEGKLPVVKVGALTRFDPAEIERFIDSHRVGGEK